MPLNISFLSCNFNIISISVNNLVFATILHLEYSLHLGDPSAFTPKQITQINDFYTTMKTQPNTQHNTVTYTKDHYNNYRRSRP